MVPVTNMTTDDRIKGRAVLFSCLYKAGETKLQIMYKVNGSESTKAQKSSTFKGPNTGETTPTANILEPCGSDDRRGLVASSNKSSVKGAKAAIQTAIPNRLKRTVLRSAKRFETKGELQILSSCCDFLFFMVFAYL